MTPRRRYAVTEADFCACGGKLVLRSGSRRRSCFDCGALEPATEILVREPDGGVGGVYVRDLGRLA